MGREVWSLRPDGDGFVYHADILRSDVRTELYYNTDATGAPLRVALTRTQSNGVSASGRFEFSGNSFRLCRTNRQEPRSELGPWDWPADGVFYTYALSTLRETHRRQRQSTSDEVRFPVYMLPRNSLDFEGAFGWGMLRLEEEPILQLPTGEMPCRVYAASFSRLKFWPFHTRLVFDRRGICHIASGGPMKYELVELEIADMHTPLPIRLKSGDAHRKHLEEP